MFAKPSSCQDCPYYHAQYVPPTFDEESLQSGIVLIGEAPAREELQSGKYFVGAAGQVLDVILEEARLPRHQVVILNVIRCDPGAYSNVTYAPKAVAKCSELLYQDLEAIAPNVIVPMGNVALKAIVGHTGITRARGKVTPRGQAQVVPTFHPAFVLRQPAYAELVVRDLELADRVSRGEETGSRKKTDYALFQSLDEVEQFFAEAHTRGHYALDTETTSLDYRDATILSLSVSHTPYSARVLPFYWLPSMVPLHEAFGPDVFDVVYRNLTEHPQTTVFMQNGKYDLRVLYTFFRRRLKKKLHPRRIRWVDTMNMAGLLDENLPKNLKELSRLHTDIMYDAEELSLVSKGQVQKMTMAQLVRYSGQDADATLRLGLKFRQSLQQQGMWHLVRGTDYSDMAVLACLFEMECFGAPMSLDKLESMRHVVMEKLESLFERMVDSVGEVFNPRSTLQVRRLLFEVLGLPPTSIVTGTGAPSTDKHALEELVTLTQHEFPRLLRLYRQYGTILDTFVEGAAKRLSKTRLRANFWCSRTVSGRIVCTQPNLANIPREKEFEEGILLSVRGLYVARPGWCVLYADWQQVEFKCAAVIAGDAPLIHALFVDGEDFHTLTAQTLFPEFATCRRQAARLEAALSTGSVRPPEKATRLLEHLKVQMKDLRTLAKNFNFGDLYGGSGAGLAGLLGLTVEAVEELSRRRREAYPELARFIEQTPRLALEQGHLESVFGRMRRFPATPAERTRSAQGREGINFGPQSAAAYVGRAALVRMCRQMRRRRMRGFPFNIVYDNIMAEVPGEEVYEALAIMTAEMLRPVAELGGHSFSIDCGVGASWAEAEKGAVKVLEPLRTPDAAQALLPAVEAYTSGVRRTLHG